MRRCNLNRFASIVLTSFVIAVAGSCEHKELCYYHPHTAPVKVNVDWSRFPMEDPTGMTAYSYLVGGKENKVFRMISHNIDYITLDLEAGFFNTIVFNQSESEYGSFEFANLEDYNTAEVRVIQVKSSWYTTRAPETKVATEPEWLAVGRQDNIEVTEEMDVRIVGKVVKCIKDTPSSTFRYMQQAVQRTKARRADGDRPRAKSYTEDDLRKILREVFGEEMKAASDWVAVYRILVDKCDAPASHTAFAEFVNALDLEEYPPCSRDLLRKADPIYIRPVYEWDKTGINSAAHDRRIGIAKKLRSLL